MDCRASFIAILVSCVFLHTSIKSDLLAHTSIRFLNQDQLAVMNEDYLSLWDVGDGKCYGKIELPAAGPHKSIAACSLSCDCSANVISVVSRHDFNYLWQLDLNAENSVWKKRASTKEFRKDWNSGVMLYTSPNGRHVVGLGHYERHGYGREHDHYEDVSNNGIAYASTDVVFIKDTRLVDWNEVFQIHLSNDGQTVLIDGYKGKLWLQGKKDSDIDWCPPIPGSLGGASCSTLSPDGRYALVQTFEVLGLLDTCSKKYIVLMRWEKKEKKLSAFSWNEKMKEYTYFPSSDECRHAYKWCAHHIQNDVCADRWDFMGTPFEGVQVIGAEFSVDGKRLLLLTKPAKQYKKSSKICMQVFDTETKSFVLSQHIKETDVAAATISPDGSNIALVSKQGEIACCPVSDDIVDLVSHMRMMSVD